MRGTELVIRRQSLLCLAVDHALLHVGKPGSGETSTNCSFSRSKFTVRRPIREGRVAKKGDKMANLAIVCWPGRKQVSIESL